MTELFPKEDARAETPLPPFSNEIFGMFIESLGEDLHSLRACSLVSSVFRHFCSPVLYRDIALDRKEQLDTFIRIGEHSESLQHTKSLSLTYYGFETKAHLRKPHRILNIISRKSSLETLRLHRVQFQAEPLTASLLSKLSTVAVLVLQECRFGGFEDFKSFVRCFPRCGVLRLHGCTWIHGDHGKLRFKGLPVYDLAPASLEITNKSSAVEWGEEFWDQGKIIGMTWLNLAGLRSFTYTIGDGIASQPVLEQIAACELLEEVDVTISYHMRHEDVITQLTPIIARIRSLTLRYSGEPVLWWLSPSANTVPPSSQTLERIRIITLGSFLMIGYCEALDAAFSDTNRYPSLEELEVCAPLKTQTGEKGRDTYERLCLDEYLPRLKALGRLPA